MEANHMLNLKLSDAKRPLVTEARKKTPNEIVLEGIQHQIGLLKSSDYKVERTRYVPVDGSDKLVKKVVTITPRPWYWRSDDGVFCIQLRYGSSHVIELEPQKPTIICGKTPDTVVKTLEAVVDGIKKGALDAPIIATSKKAKRSAA